MCELTMVLWITLYNSCDDHLAHFIIEPAIQGRINVLKFHGNQMCLRFIQSAKCSISLGHLQNKVFQVVYFWLLCSEMIPKDWS